jgi:hypothetical protein
LRTRESLAAHLHQDERTTPDKTKQHKNEPADKFSTHKKNGEGQKTG